MLSEEDDFREEQAMGGAQAAKMTALCCMSMGIDEVLWLQMFGIVKVAFTIRLNDAGE